MQSFYKLKNSIRHYQWGSTDYIPALLKTENLEHTPWAELWMGAHPDMPSSLQEDKHEIPLNSFLAQHPQTLHVANKLKHPLPFLFKVLSVNAPLSIQVHPNAKQAQEGYEREQAAELSPDKRSYVDPFPKPEIVYALDTFTALCGFRSIEDIAARFPPASEYPAFIYAQKAVQSASHLKILESLLNTSEVERERLCKQAVAYAQKTVNTPESSLVLQLYSQYPTDPAICAPWFLNLVTLESGEALFLPAGILHAYIQGPALELMGNSDNVLRGGLSSKLINKTELFLITKDCAFQPQKPVLQYNASCSSAAFIAPSGEFILLRIELSDTSEQLVMLYASIAFVLTGTLCLQDTVNREIQFFKQGESIFIPASRNPIELSGTGTVFLAYSEKPLQ